MVLFHLTQVAHYFKSRSQTTSKNYFFFWVFYCAQSHGSVFEHGVTWLQTFLTSEPSGFAWSATRPDSLPRRSRFQKEAW